MRRRGREGRTETEQKCLHVETELYWVIDDDAGQCSARLLYRLIEHGIEWVVDAVPLCPPFPRLGLLLWNLIRTGKSNYIQ